MNPQELIGFFRTLVPTWLKEDLPSAAYVYATVTALDPSNELQVKIQRSDETFADNQYYPTLGPYSPEVGDRVFCFRTERGLVCRAINKDE